MVPTQEYPVGSSRFDWALAGLSAWMVGGLYLDGWAHRHGKVDDVFLTPWHAILYSGVLVTFIFLLFNQARNMSRGHTLRRSLPRGYLLSLVGVTLFLLGGTLDFLWHTLFGIEVDLETLLSPTHLLLATSGVLMISGPMRATWARLSRDEARGWKRLGPLALSAALILSIVTFFTQFAHPISEPYARKVTGLDQGRVSDIYVMNADGTGQMRLTATPKMYAWSGAWSPDGRQVVFTQGEATEGDNPESALYLMNADGQGTKQLTDMPGQEYVPAWSPDGTRIAFVSQVGQKQELYAINVDGSHLQQLTDTTTPAYGPAWSPDGARIVYTSNAGGSDQLYVMNGDGSHSTQLTIMGLYNWGAVWSPDGRRIAFNSVRDDNTDIYVINADGRGEKRLTDAPADDYNPTWSPDGRQIAFVSWRDDKADIYVMNVEDALQGTDGSRQRNLTYNHALEITSPKWSPDGKTIMFSAAGHTTFPNPYQTKSLAIVSLLLQSALLMGVVLMLVRHWTLPFGALTLMFTLNGLLMSVLNDRYLLALPGLGAGLIADILLRWLKPSAERLGRFSLFGFSVPVVFCALYFLALQMTQGIEWTIHLWLGSIFMAGLIGLCVGFLTVSPLSTAQESAK